MISGKRTVHNAYGSAYGPMCIWPTLQIDGHGLLLQARCDDLREEDGSNVAPSQWSHLLVNASMAGTGEMQKRCS